MIKRTLLKTTSMITLAITIMAFSPNLTHAAWKQNSTGWWYSEGSSWATGWKEISGTWYYFDADGYMKTGWVKDGSTWYYLNENGAMQTGWILYDSNWYYLNESGAMETSWVKVGHDWYFLNESGVMQTGWIEDDSKTYYLNESGAMIRLDIIDGYFVAYDGVRGSKVIIDSVDSADKLVNEADSNYIKALTEKDKTIGFKNPVFNESKYVAGLMDYDIENEPVFTFVLSSTNPDSFECYHYFVGAYTGKVYAGPDQGGFKLYEIKNNEIVKSYASKSNPNSPDWR